MASNFAAVSGKGPSVSSHGLGRVHHRRHRKLARDNILGVTKSSIRKLARRGGVRRIQSSIYNDIRAAVKARLELILQRICHILESTGPAFEVEDYHRQPRELMAMRKTVKTTDVVFALNSLGMTLYGFGWYEMGVKKRARKRDAAAEGSGHGGG